jgi:hypothetical protein
VLCLLFTHQTVAERTVRRDPVYDVTESAVLFFRAEYVFQSNTLCSGSNQHLHTYVITEIYVLSTGIILCSLYSWHSIVHLNLCFIRFHHFWLARSLPSVVATILVHFLLAVQRIFYFLIVPLIDKPIQSMVEKHIKLWRSNTSTVFPKPQFM